MGITILFLCLPVVVLFILQRDLQKRREKSDLQEKYRSAQIFSISPKKEDSAAQPEQQPDDLKKSA